MSRKKGPRLPEGDDGRTIVNMNVEGMPWYLEKGEGSAMPGAGDDLTSHQRRAYGRAAIRAGLAVALVFGGVYALFIAFCDFVWFR